MLKFQLVWDLVQGTYGPYIYLMSLRSPPLTLSPIPDAMTAMMSTSVMLSWIGARGFAPCHLTSIMSLLLLLGGDPPGPSPPRGMRKKWLSTRSGLGWTGAQGPRYENMLINSTLLESSYHHTLCASTTGDPVIATGSGGVHALQPCAARVFGVALHLASTGHRKVWSRMHNPLP